MTPPGVIADEMATKCHANVPPGGKKGDGALSVDLYDERTLTVSVSHNHCMDRLAARDDFPMYNSCRDDNEVARFSGCPCYGLLTVLDRERTLQHVEHCRVGSMMMPTGRGPSWDG